MDEEVVLLEEQLAAAHADIERLQTLLAESEARAAEQAGEAGSLRRELESALSARDADLASHGEALSSLRGELDAATSAQRDATARYRVAALAREPELPADLVTGDTVADVDESLSRARQTVAQVRQHLEQQAQALRVPAGAPARGSPDISALTAAEKIRLGLQQA